MCISFYRAHRKFLLRYIFTLKIYRINKDDESKRTKRSKATETETCYMEPLGTTWNSGMEYEKEPPPPQTDDKATSMDIDVTLLLNRGMNSTRLVSYLVESCPLNLPKASRSYQDINCLKSVRQVASNKLVGRDWLSNSLASGLQQKNP